MIFIFSADNFNDAIKRISYLKSYRTYREMQGQNIEWLDTLYMRLGQKEGMRKLDFCFPAGSMYWFRIAALSRLLDESLVSIDEFEFEAGQLDGTLAHAIERIVGIIVALNQYEVAAIN